MKLKNWRRRNNYLENDYQWFGKNSVIYWAFSIKILSEVLVTGDKLFMNGNIDIEEQLFDGFLVIHN